MSRPGPIGLLRDAWWAASAPSAFFYALQAAPQPRLGRAALAALAAGAVAAGVGALAFVRATDSDGFILAWGLLSAIGLPYLAMMVFLGGLVMVRPGQLDLRAWEIAAWSWVPAGVLGVSLLPAALVVPGPAAALGLAAFPIWHLTLVMRGVRAFAPHRVALLLALYVLAVYGVPALLTGVSYALMQALRGAA